MASEFLLKRHYRPMRQITATDDEMNVEQPAPVAVQATAENNGYNTETIKNNTYRVGRSRSRDKKATVSKKLAEQGGIPAKKPRNKKAAAKLKTESRNSFMQSVIHATQDQEKKKELPTEGKGAYKFEWKVPDPIKELALESSSSDDEHEELPRKSLASAAKATNFRMQTKGVLDEGRINLTLPKERPLPPTPVDINSLKNSLPLWFQHVENVKIAEIVQFLRDEKSRVAARRKNKAYLFLTFVAGFVSRPVTDLVNKQSQKLFETVDERIAYTLNQLALSMPTTPLSSPTPPVTTTLPVGMTPKQQRRPVVPLTNNPALNALIKEHNASPGSSITINDSRAVHMTPDEFVEYVELKGDMSIKIEMTGDEMLLTMAKLFDTFYQPDVINIPPVRLRVPKPRTKGYETGEATEVPTDLPTDLEMEEEKSEEEIEQRESRRISPVVLGDAQMRIKSGAPPIQVAPAPTGKDILLNYLSEKDLILQYFKEYYDRKAIADLGEQIALNNDYVVISDIVLSNTEYALTLIKTWVPALISTEFEQYLEEKMVMTQFALLTANCMTRGNNLQTTRDQRVYNLKDVPMQKRDVMTFFQDCYFDGIAVRYQPQSRTDNYNLAPQYIYPAPKQLLFPGSKSALPPRFEF